MYIHILNPGIFFFAKNIWSGSGKEHKALFSPISQTELPTK